MGVGSHSERQFEDIRNLLESGVDEEFVKKQIVRLDLGNVWKAFEEWKIRVAK